MNLNKKFSKSEIDRMTVKVTEEADVVKLEELDPKKIYHVVTDVTDVNPDSIKKLVEAFHSLGLRAIFSQGKVQVEEIASMFQNLPEEKKATLREALEPKNESPTSQS